MRKVIISRELTRKDATASKGYIMKGNKGVFMLARDTEGRFIWVRLNPPKITKVFNAYDTLQEALDYASKGKEVIALNINKDKYLNLIRLLIEYKADKPGASKELVDTYFKTRWQLRVFTTRLAQRGHYYMSTERLLGYFGIEEETDEEE